MKRFVYTLILSILMSASYYNDVCAEEYTADTADCFSFNNETSKNKVYKFFCFDKKTGQGITGTYKQIVDGRLDTEIPFKDGNRDGIQTWYDKDGKIEFTEEYKDGEKIK